MNEEEKLPIRVVRTKQEPKNKKGGGGDKKIFFKDEEKEKKFPIRQESLIEDIKNIEVYFQESFKKHPNIPHVSKAQLVEKAIAKSHRPTYLFSEDTCPIIGVGRLGQLFVKTAAKRLNALKRKIRQKPDSKTTINKWEANISVTLNLSPFKEDDRLKEHTPESLMELLERDGRSTIKVKLFDFFDREADGIAKKEFIRLVNQLNLHLDSVGEHTRLGIWKVEDIDIESLKELATFPAIKELSIFPRYKLLRPSGKQTKSSILIPAPGSKDYPVAGLLDTGIPEKHSLRPWVVESISFVPPELSNHYHGCSVGALLIMAHHFNSLDIDENFLKIINVEILGNTDEDIGKPDKVYEDEFIRRLEDYFENAGSNIPKIWNMSLGFDDMCGLERFSDLAIFLDKLQDQHNLLFILPSGNYNKKSFRTWPPNANDVEINENYPNQPPDYLTKPADCIRAVTVGAIACDEKKTSLVHKDQPTSYSRRGPGPSFIPKPEVVHYSGNVSLMGDGEHILTNTGINSLDDVGRITDYAGTSYAAPLVTRFLAFLSHYITPEPSLLLLKALLIHNARMLESFGNLENLFYYVGFGLPVKAVDALFCLPYEITLIIEDKLQSGDKLEYPFSWPDSLRINNKIKGECKATLVSKPPLDNAFGAEYVRADVKFSLQSKKTKESGEENWKGLIPEDPCKLKLKKRYESELIKDAFKWSPVKKYYKRIPRGITSEELKIKIDLFLRDGLDMKNFSGEIPFALILTIRDFEKRFPIYNEVVLNLGSLGIRTEEIGLRGRVREMVR
jgi:serine protease AprX